MSAATSNKATTVALYFSAPRSKGPDLLNLAVWTCHPQFDANNKLFYQLCYYSLPEDPHQWYHLLAVLCRAAPIESIHIASNVKNAASNQILENLLEFLNKDFTVAGLWNNSGDEITPNQTDGTSNIIVAQSTNFARTDSPYRLEQLLRPLLSVETETYQWLADRHANDTNLAAAGLLLLDAVGLQPGSSIVRLRAGVADSHLVLDRAAQQALLVRAPPQHERANEGNSSLSTLVGSHVQTPMGLRLWHSWLAAPLIDLDPLIARQDAVVFLVKHGVIRNSIREQGCAQFKSTDLAVLAQQLGKYQGCSSKNLDDDESSPFGSTRAALQALYNLFLVANQKTPILLEYLPKDEEETPTLLADLFRDLNAIAQQLIPAQELAQAVLDLDQAPREFLVKATYSPELREIKDELMNLDEQIQECHALMNEVWAQASGSNQEDSVRLERDSNSDWFFRLANTNDAKLLQNQLGDTVRVHKVLKNGVYFSTKQLRQLATHHADLLASYERHQRTVVVDALQVAATYEPLLMRASPLIATLDVLTGLAQLAAHSPHEYCLPELTDSNEAGHGIILKNARHPCVELQENVEFIPNDVSLVYGESSFLIVTGPNMGGKSTYIRALGAIVTLAQVGSLVPCSSAKINLCHHILARVGAGDLQHKGISTFMAEMLESSSILRTATKRSLIIIDELGRGTSTFDGYGLARAISEYIVQSIGCLTVFATHFHELTVLEQTESTVRNCHVTAQKGSQGLTFLYQIKPGPCLESFGIQVAEMANMPKVVVEDAKKKAQELENFEYKSLSRNNVDDASGGAEFLDRFKQIPLDKIISQPNMSDEDKKQAILLALQSV